MTQIWQTIKASAVEAWREYWRPFLWWLPINWQSKLKLTKGEGSEFSKPVWWLVATTLVSAILAGAVLYAFVNYLAIGFFAESPSIILIIVAVFAVIRIAFYVLNVGVRDRVD